MSSARPRGGHGAAGGGFAGVSSCHRSGGTIHRREQQDLLLVEEQENGARAQGRESGAGRRAGPNRADIILRVAVATVSAER